MTNSKSSYQDEDLLPFFKGINDGQDPNKEEVIKCIQGNDMRPPQFQKKDKIIHHDDLTLK